MPDETHSQRGREGRGPTTGAQRRDAYADSELGKSSEGQRILRLEAELHELRGQFDQLNNLINTLQGTNGIEVKLPVIAGPEKVQVQRVALAVCDKASGEQKTYNFHVD